MRPKFRAWHKKEKKMYEVPTIWFYAEKVSLGKKGTDLKNVILLQSTGLKDKNEKEIYSGDLINCKDEEIWHGDGQIFEVYWDNKTCGFKLKTKDKMTGCWSLDEVGEIEVIGNIMENPELLKGGEKK